MLAGQVLIIDPNEASAAWTGGLLAGRGHRCQTVQPADAGEAIAREQFDLLIAEIAGRSGSQVAPLVQLSESHRDLSILVTSEQPTVAVAMELFKLPIVAFMPRPLDADALINHVQVGIERSRAARAIGRTQQRLRSWLEDLQAVETALPQVGLAPRMPLATFVDLTIGNIHASLLDLKLLLEVTASDEARQDICGLRECPRLQMMTNAVEETTDTLERTKSLFKSKDLGDLRRKLELLLNRVKQIPDGY